MTPTFGPLLEHPYPKIQETMQQHLGHIFKGEQNGHLFAQQLLLIVDTSLVNMESNT
jgi:hypothetical protein